MREIASLDALKVLVGQDVGTSEWIDISQNDVNQFAQATGDHQWIHTDPERAEKESPFGGPVAHGFLTLSLLPALMSKTIQVRGVRMGVNYGLNRVRFTAPVPVGAAVRLHAKLVSVDAPDSSVATLTWAVTMEAQGIAKPVCVAETLSRLYF
ncbi:putative enoyl-CoA hydratase 1 [Cupriavidus taiwanensis]|uniref:MaoC family dehydratase n=1 Tax=Cupriavidus taiwanensis TaxID=164546 RepID=UPI000E14ED8A|nr:MaoC family dehydratase [Cupriavidus taiwanensis]SPA03841.1 putative enoyl-CoA hydratase 1 [Cupriavidus taiwanensis]